MMQGRKIHQSINKLCVTWTVTVWQISNTKRDARPYETAHWQVIEQPVVYSFEVPFKDLCPPFYTGLDSATPRYSSDNLGQVYHMQVLRVYSFVRDANKDSEYLIYSVFWLSEQIYCV